MAFDDDPPRKVSHRGPAEARPLTRHPIRARLDPADTQEALERQEGAAWESREGEQDAKPAERGDTDVDEDEL